MSFVALRGLPELIEKQNSLGCPVKIVVYDSTMPWILDIANQLGLYGAVFSTESCAVGAVYYHMHRGSLKIGPAEGSTVSLPSMPLMETNSQNTETRNKPLEKHDMGSIKTHALVLPFPVQGHINPMLQFSKRLASKGVKVTLVATTNSIQPPDNSIDIEYIPDGSDQTDQKKDAGLERFKLVASRVLPDLIEKLNGYGSCPVKLVVYDSILPWALDIAHELDGFIGRENVVLPSMPLMGVKDLPSFISDMDAYPALLRLVLDRFSNFEKADWLLFNSFDKLECEVVNWMASQWPIKTIGPTIPSVYLHKRLEDDKDYGLSLFKPSDEDCIKWLDTKETGSVVYVSFGSLANLGEDQMEELACGLKQSNRYFLWVVRASEETGVRVKVDEKGMIKREEIEMCIREVMEGERGNELKRNAVRWKEFAREAVDEGGSSDKHIEEFISELVCR
ncbi:hypothetical protein RJ639_015012 [Escallonia herrerae]|uniref:Glycosyltransferase N-terminal domain-containing protein n=1 Tax=Escallonia herrerae TaxID=1293975 RepID=A0AA88VIG9_9ASTE|nr:hypothetical protein RJ639_015012 [Escallonia herrerae]